MQLNLYLINCHTSVSCFLHSQKVTNKNFMLPEFMLSLRDPRAVVTHRKSSYTEERKVTVLLYLAHFPSSLKYRHLKKA